MLLKSFKRRVPRATAIVLQFNNIKRELSARGWKRGTGRTTPPPRDPSPHVGDRRNEPRPANPLIPFIFLLSTITPFIFLSGSSRRRFREGTTNDEFRSFRQFKFVWLLSYLIVQCSPRLLYPSSISLLFFSSLRINLIPFIFLLSTITPFIFLSGSSRRRFREGTTNDEFRQFKFLVFVLSYRRTMFSKIVVSFKYLSLLFSLLFELIVEVPTFHGFVLCMG